MDARNSPAAALAALDAHFAGMPPVAALQPQVLDWQPGLLRLRAPLAANINDKGCAFGGSMGSLMTIACWGLVSMELESAGLHADVFVADSRVRYLKPVFEDIVVEASFDDAGEHAQLAEALRRQGRVSVRLQAKTLLADGAVAAVFTGRYVGIGKA